VGGPLEGRLLPRDDDDGLGDRPPTAAALPAAATRGLPAAARAARLTALTAVA
jgi:hypothetical protein